MSLSRQILIGLGCGVAVGLFLGEGAGIFQLAADAYVKLLQMTVLPYVTVSLISGLGRLDYAQAKSLGLRAGCLLAILWLIAIGGVLLFPLTFPSIETASFFSTTLIEDREPFDLLSLYIPANPFNSLANNVVPAVVLFSVVLGVALIGVPEKKRLLDILDVVNAAVSRANNLVVRLTPLGIFAIAASASGTLAIEQIERLQVYLIGYIAITLLMSLWILPGLITTVTPLRYGEVIGAMRDVLVTAFMTANLFIVLPMLVEKSQALMRAHGLGGERDAALPEVIVPASFNFPHVGKLLTLSFILFAGWFADAAVAASDYPRLATTGLVVLFGSINAAVPFLLDLFRIPADTFQLLLATSVVNARFGTLVAAAHTIVMALLGSWAIAGRLQLQTRRIVRYVVVTAVLTILTVASARAICAAVVSAKYDRDQMLMGMGLSLGHGPAKVVDSFTPSSDGDVSAIRRVRATKLLRVCFPEDALPFAFINGQGALVGFDVEMAQELAGVFDATAEFKRIDRRDMVTVMDGACDVMVGGIAVTAERAGDIRFSKSYLDETVAFVVQDNLRQAYATWADIRRRGRITIAMPPLREFEVRLRAELPEAQFEHVQDLAPVFDRLGKSVEALAITAERGSAWTLLHPAFTVAVPRPVLFKVPLAFPLERKDQNFATLVDTWIDLKTKDGTVDALYSRWILGRVETSREPRWSIVRNVLHWAR